MGNSGKLAYHRFKLSHSDRGQRQNHMKKNHTMLVHRSIGVCATTIAALLFLQPILTWAQTPSPTTKEASQNGASLRDGRHDFDFALGGWKFHLKKLEHPLTGSNTWIELDGHSNCRKIWDGANLDQVEVYSADRKTHIQGLTLRLYNPESHQWSLYWGNAAKGALSLPAVVGEFKNGRGEFYDQEDYNGRMILVRYAWSDITPTSAHFEQAFSTDGGKTWETNWITDQTRERP
jgi:hypothetical protein